MKLSIIPFILTKLKQGLGIVQDTDTATQAIAKDKYVFWKGSLKKASSAISQNDTLSASNLGDVTGGALNELSEHIAQTDSTVLKCVKIFTVSKGSVTIKTKNNVKQMCILVFNMNWFDEQRSVTLYRLTSQPTTLKQVLAGNDIFTFNSSGTYVTVTDSVAYSGAQTITIVDLFGNIASVE